MTLPKIHNIDKIIFPVPESFRLKNDLEVFGFNGLKNDIIRIDLLFNSGRWTEPAPLIAESCAKLFKSGTHKLSSFELNEKIDSYGSTIKASSGYNTFTVSLYCMHRFLEPSLQLLITCLTEIIFPEHELELLQKNAISKLKISKEKNDYLADVCFKKTVFGETHPYGYETTDTTIQSISTALLKQFYAADLRPENCTVFIAGKYGDTQLKLIDKYLGNWHNHSENSLHHTVYTKNGNKASADICTLRIKKENTVQASIVIGKEFFNKQHPDYAGFLLLNTILGGYFGSRLMSNIREEKGLTYGIHSSMASLKYSGIFSIQTDTNLENLELCLGEIYFELERLQKEPVPEQEIKLARNYLLGKFLSRTDGPFSQIDIFKSYYIENVGINKFEAFVETIRQTDALSLQRLAQQYLLKESMYEIVVG